MSSIYVLVVFATVFPLSCNPRKFKYSKRRIYFLAFAMFWTCKLRYEELVFIILVM
jgi:hypothetical protein